MTIQQLYLFNGLYLIVVIAVAYFTRATARRLVGALVAGAVISVVALGIIVLGERVGWWHMVIDWAPYPLTLLLIGLAECAFIYLLTWRIVRRFGSRGLAVSVVVAAIIGPPRDYSVHGEVSRVGWLRARTRARDRDRRNLRVDRRARPRGHVAGRRTVHSGPACAPELVHPFIEVAAEVPSCDSAGRGGRTSIEQACEIGAGLLRNRFRSPFPAHNHER